MSISIPNAESNNYDVFRDSLSAVLVQRLTQTPTKPARRSKHQQNKSPEPGPLPDDADDLSDFIDYIGSEIFTTLPARLRTLDWHTWSTSLSLQSAYSLPLTAQDVSPLVTTLDPSISDSRTAPPLSATLTTNTPSPRLWHNHVHRDRTSPLNLLCPRPHPPRPPRSHSHRLPHHPHHPPAAPILYQGPSPSLGVRDLRPRLDQPELPPPDPALRARQGGQARVAPAGRAAERGVAVRGVPRAGARVCGARGAGAAVLHGRAANGPAGDGGVGGVGGEVEVEGDGEEEGGGVRGACASQGQPSHC